MLASKSLLLSLCLAAPHENKLKRSFVSLATPFVARMAPTTKEFHDQSLVAKYALANFEEQSERRYEIIDLLKKNPDRKPSFEFNEDFFLYDIVRIPQNVKNDTMFLQDYLMLEKYLALSSQISKELSWYRKVLHGCHFERLGGDKIIHFKDLQWPCNYSEKELKATQLKFKSSFVNQCYDAQILYAFQESKIKWDKQLLTDSSNKKCTLDAYRSAIIGDEIAFVEATSIVQCLRAAILTYFYINK